ncbi:MAG: helix-turn-helix domain-containing protein [Bacteroidota bacterium]
MEQNLWTILLTYSFVQGLVVGLYSILQFRRSLLGLLLLTVSALTLSHLYYRFEWFEFYPHYLLLDMPIRYVIGPLFLFFTRRLFDGRTRPLEMTLHFVPTMALCIYLWPFFYSAEEDKASTFGDLLSSGILTAEIDQYLFSIHLLGYLMYSYLIFQRLSLRQRERSAQTTLVFDLLASRILRLFLVFTLLAFGVLVFTDAYDRRMLDWYSLLYLTLSTLTQLTFYYALQRQVGPDQADRFRRLSSKEIIETPELSEAETLRITEQVHDHVSSVEIYRNPELRLRHVSKQLGIPSHEISQSLKVQLRKTFFDLVNEQRVEGFRHHVGDPRYANYTLSAVAAEHGFKNASSFQRIFKKYTGKTPQEYMNALFVANAAEA